MKWLRYFIVVMVFLVGQAGSLAQDFTNRGKDFWLCFPSHVPNQREGVTYYARMSVFITGNKNSTGAVSIPGVFYSSFTVTAGQVTEVYVPYHLAHITEAEAGTVMRKGIRVQTDPGKPPVVVYAHIYAGFRSAASLILPVAVLGKKYYSMNAPQVSVPGSKSQFVVMAVDTATTVQITPVRNGVKGTPYSINLPLPGHLYEMQDDQDLSGTLIESISPGPEGCRKIAVFSGSSAIHINGGFCTPGDSYDPLYQQLYPVHAWGKQYGFIPFQNYTNGNLYRVLAAEDNTQVYINGFPVALLNAGECYPGHAGFGVPETNAMMLTADKPVCMVQYAQSSACSGANPPAGTGYGDPDMVVLNPIEQQINDITIFSSQKENIFSNSRFINVLIDSDAATSFTVNGAAPGVNWSALPGSVYAYARIQLPGGVNACTLKADSSFNVIAYGFGDFESYAYSAGTHVKDLYRTITIENEFGHGDEPVGCSGRSFRISVTYPYQPQAIHFQFYGLFTDAVINNPVPVETITMNGKTVYRYRLSDQLSVSNPGTYPLTVIAENSNGSDCNSGMDEMDYELVIVDRPQAGFTFTHTGCVTDAVQFADASDSKGNTFSHWNWNFGDQQSATIDSPLHTYAYGNAWTVTHWAVTDFGCGTDTSLQEIHVTGTPVASFSTSTPVCEDGVVVFTGQAQVGGHGTIAAYNWDFGDQQQVFNTSGDPVSHQYDAAGSFTATLQVATNSGCKSAVSSQPVTVHPRPVAAFHVPVFCLPEGTGRFENQSEIVNGTSDDLVSAWDFGDGQTSGLPNPLHTYTATGPYTVRLQVTSMQGCSDDTTITVNSIFPQAKPQATIKPENCLGDLSHVAVKMKSAGYNDLQVIYWSTDQISNYDDTIVGDHTKDVILPVRFSAPGAHAVRIFATTETGCNTDTIVAPVYVNDLPVAAFDISSPRCAGQPVQFFDHSTSVDGAIANWTWNFGNGMHAADASPATVFVAGQYSVSLQVETNKGCRSPAVIYPVIVSPVPVPDFEMPEVCVADPYVLFTDKSTIADGSETLLQYKWHFGDQLATPANPDSAMIRHPQHKYAASGHYAVSLRVTSKDGCTADTVKMLTVNGARVQAGFVLNEGAPLCTGGPVMLRNTSSVDAGDIIRLEIYWNYDRDPLQNTKDENPVLGKTYLYNYPALTTGETYRLKYIVYSGDHCMHSIDTVITVYPSPVLQFNELPAICENSDPVLLTLELPAMDGSGQFTGRGITPPGLFRPAMAGPGLHTITYTFQADNGCAAASSQNIEVMPAPLVDAGPDKVIREGVSVQLEGSASGQGLSYSWIPATHIDSPSAEHPLVWPIESTVYRLTVETARGCSAWDEATVSVINKINVPNAFTPNRDGKNDRWNIPHLALFDNCSVQVFNRWGQKVFQSKGYAHPWDGTCKGIELPAGAYSWVIDLKNGRRPMKGFVILVR